MKGPEDEVERSRQLVEEAERKDRCADKLNQVKQKLVEVSSEARFSHKETAFIATGGIGVVVALIIAITASGLWGLIILLMALITLGVGGFYHITRIKRSMKDLEEMNNNLERCLHG